MYLPKRNRIDGNKDIIFREKYKKYKYKYHFDTFKNRNRFFLEYKFTLC